MIPLPVTRVKIWKGPLHGTKAIIGGELPNILPGLRNGHVYRLRRSLSGDLGYVYTDASKLIDGVMGGKAPGKRRYHRDNHRSNR